MIATSDEAGLQQGAGAWAGEGGWVFEIDSTPSWELRSLLEGRVPRPDGSYGGVLMRGEVEHAMLAQVPSERIVAIHKMGLHPNGSLIRTRTLWNPNYRPVTR